MSIDAPAIFPLRQAFAHFPQIGPSRLRLLRESGVHNWEDIEPTPPPQLNTWSAFWAPIYQTALACREADAADNIQFFIDVLEPQDRWRLLHKHWSQCAFLDIETSGLEFEAEITVISVFYQNRLHLFVRHENLDDFPNFILNIPFLVTYNGSTFDLPKIIRFFNLPPLPVPHVDLRWLCHRLDLTGGLKSIEQMLDIRRPDDLQGTDGNDAILLWRQWQDHRRPTARYRLLKYCAADTLSLKLVTDQILERHGCPPDNRPDQTQIWSVLKQIPQPEAEEAPSSNSDATVRAVSDSSSLTALQDRLRAFLDKKRRF